MRNRCCYHVSFLIGIKCLIKFIGKDVTNVVYKDVTEKF